MVRRILDTGISVYGGSRVGNDTVAVVAVVAELGGMYDSTSLRMMRPSGPDPLSLAKGIPRSSAIFFAMGDAKTRSPLGRSRSIDLEGSFCCVGGEGVPDSAALEDGGEPVSWEGSPCGEGVEDCFASSSAPEISSPCSPIIAIGDPTGILFVPSLATILAKTPSS